MNALRNTHAPVARVEHPQRPALSRLSELEMSYKSCDGDLAVFLGGLSISGGKLEHVLHVLSTEDIDSIGAFRALTVPQLREILPEKHGDRKFRTVGLINALSEALSFLH